MKQALFFLAFLMCFAVLPAKAQRNPACHNGGRDGVSFCLKQENPAFSLLRYPLRASLPSHAIRLITINGEVALLKLSFPRLQYEDFCQKAGITFKPASFPGV